MTPKDKAQELFEKMYTCYQGHLDAYTAKQCALILVVEILNEYWSHDTKRRNWWIEVKHELEKL